MRLWLILFATFLLGSMATPIALAHGEKPPVDFLKQIRPLFEKHCHQCHGADTQEAGLRLDLRADALAGSDSGPVIVAGRSDESLLIKLVSDDDRDRLMPPEGDRLSRAQVLQLRTWIDAGAEWPDSVAGDESSRRSNHWAFQPIRAAEAPLIANRRWSRNYVDAYISHKLEQNGTNPSSEAQPETLVRRAFLDLVGTLPSPDEVDRLVNDQIPDAYEKMIDRLLASPRFGERWGRHWLDLARYADSDGYEKDEVRPFAWRWRDWVISAFNSDMPFDQFTIEQLAGDLLPNATLEQKVATGLHRNTLISTEGGSDQEEFRVKATVDRVNTTGAAWMGLTIGCAQCHSHKYDPISQREYYQMFAFFNSLDRVDIPAPTAVESLRFAVRKQRFDRDHAPFLRAVADYEKSRLAPRLAEWEATRPERFMKWTIVEPTGLQSAGKSSFEKQPDGSWLVTGTSPDSDTWSCRVTSPLADVTGIRLEVLPDERLPASGPGRAKHGNLVLSEFSISAKAANGKGPGPLALSLATADHEQDAGGKKPWLARHAIDGNVKTGWAIGPAYAQPHVIVFQFAESVTFPSGTELSIKLEQQYGAQHTIGRFRLALTNGPRPVIHTDVRASIAAILDTRTEQRNSAKSQELLDWYRDIDSGYQELKREAREHSKQAPSPPATRAQTLRQRDQERTTNILIRGDFLRKGAQVEPSALRVLNRFQPRSGKADRVDLANWILALDNPLTRRVAANRIWQHLFGRGLVETAEDFGTRGARPSHPELLDRLAGEFSRGLWSRKRLIRLIVSSAAYRQTSHPRAELMDVDPGNQLLARQNRFRLEAESVRDVYLAASGLLDDRIGGPSVRPPLPAGVAELGFANRVKWAPSGGADRYRRGIYIFFQRTVPYPMLMTFDSPDSNVTCTRRERSNTPLQALTLLNGPVFFECAQHLGQRAFAAEPVDRAARVDHMFRLCLSRRPDDSERDQLVRLYDEYGAALAADRQAAKTLAPGSSDSAAVETAAAIAVGRVVLNLDEMVTRE